MQRRGIGGFPCYDVQAKTREQVIKAMEKKRGELQIEVDFYDEGLKKIPLLQDREFYEMSYDEAVYFVQCWKFGRDHVEFRIFTSDKTPRNLRDHMSLGWNWDFKVTPVDPKNAALYVHHEFKTEYFEKLLKGKYRGFKKVEGGSKA